MTPARWLYRVRQVWHVLTARPSPKAHQYIATILSPGQERLFHQLKRSDQAHALEVLIMLEEQGFDHPDLQVAALLHDVGKARHPLGLWDRVIAVLGRALFPERAATWGRGHPRGILRPFVIAAQHPEWGAQMAQKAGTSKLALEIIRRHQEKITHPKTDAEALILALQSVDDLS